MSLRMRLSGVLLIVRRSLAQHALSTGVTAFSVALAAAYLTYFGFLKPDPVARWFIGAAMLALVTTMAMSIVLMRRELAKTVTDDAGARSLHRAWLRRELARLRSWRSTLIPVCVIAAAVAVLYLQPVLEGREPHDLRVPVATLVAALTVSVRVMWRALTDLPRLETEFVSLADAAG
jgi:hypothetical protein